MKRMFFITTAVLIMALAGQIFADPEDLPACGVSGMMYGSYGSGFLVLSWITYILIIGLILASIYWLIKSANKKR